MNLNEKAKVFISCGQTDGSIEREIARVIQARLISLGYKTYLAFEQHTPNALKEDIFRNLFDSEYFLFIDFRRESLNNTNEYRGSLYTNQELAIAVYLNKEIIPFQQEGVKKLDGMLSTSILNPIPFSDNQISQLPDLIQDQIQNKWSNEWKNKLSICIKPSYQDAKKISGDIGRHYHLVVHNLHKDKIALNCTAYIRTIKDVSSKKDIPTETVELKWGGSLIPNVSIMPTSYRLLDAFFVFHSHPNILYFLSYSDSDRNLPPLGGANEYEITYVVISENFPSVEFKARITITGSINSIGFVQSL